MDSFALWKWKMAWIRPLADQAKKICSKESLKIKKFASWKGYPKLMLS